MSVYEAELFPDLLNAALALLLASTLPFAKSSS